jgi:hypothetical protein
MRDNILKTYLTDCDLSLYETFRKITQQVNETYKTNILKIKYIMAAQSP